MEPTLKSGQIVWVSRWAFFLRNPRVGEVIVFQNNREAWVKRILKVSKEGITVTGDNQNDSHQVGLITKKQILGKVIFPKD